MPNGSDIPFRSVRDLERFNRVNDKHGYIGREKNPAGRSLAYSHKPVEKSDTCGAMRAMIRRVSIGFKQSAGSGDILRITDCVDNHDLRLASQRSESA